MAFSKDIFYLDTRHESFGDVLWNGSALGKPKIISSLSCSFQLTNYNSDVWHSVTVLMVCLLLKITTFLCILFEGKIYWWTYRWGCLRDSSQNSQWHFHFISYFGHVFKEPKTNPVFGKSWPKLANFIILMLNFPSYFLVNRTLGFTLPKSC